MMKKVIVKDSDVGLITVPNCRKDLYYGFRSMSKTKGFISMKNYDSDVCIALACKDITVGNSFMGEYRTLGLHEMLNKLIKYRFNVYCFDTAQELFRWLSED